MERLDDVYSGFKGFFLLSDTWLPHLGHVVGQSLGSHRPGFAAALALTSSVALGESLHPSESQFSLLQNVSHDVCLRGLLCRLNKVMEW